MIVLKIFSRLLILTLLIPLLASSAFPENYIDFDSIAGTAPLGVPQDGGSWHYESNATNKIAEISSCGWYDSTRYPTNSNIFDFFYWYVNTYNNDHMGWTTYGYLEIDSSIAVKGNSLRLHTTGGVNSDGAQGTAIFSKEAYLQTTSPESLTTVGHPTIYFLNNSSSSSPVYFYRASGSNRLSLYLKMPDSVNNGTGGSGNPVTATTSIGPFNDIGGHWYHSTYNRGGGWTHILLDGHPHHNNAWSDATKYPYPSYSLRDYDISYFDTMYRLYITFMPYSGIAQTPYDIWIDEINFFHDSEPQNSETINSPAITYHQSSNLFEISFSDKYKNNGNSYSTYEVRYSFSEITNANWDTATPVIIQEDTRFRIQNRTDGKFQKWWPYYVGVWAPFKISTNDESKLLPGTTIYFAIKDISQVNGDSTVPVDGINGTWISRKGGRPYDTNPTAFDYDGDKPKLKLIKRINFLIPKSTTIVNKPNAPTMLQIVQ